ncbi:MAG: indole-3-glycerol phosphate synthase TrpC, partial [bacterium]
IAASRKKAVEALKAERPVGKILERLVGAPAGRSFRGALKAVKGLALIAEVKRASPSKGLLMDSKQSPAKLAALYAAAGATAISVVTEPKFFKGSGAMIEEVKKACPLPVLRKDFIVDTWQLYESKLLRADAVLLIAALLPESRDLKRMIAAANNLSLTPLVEVHTADELKRVLRAEAEYIGINNRDLTTFKVDLKITERLIKLVPEDKFVVSESGIVDAAGAGGLWKQGVRGVLVGEALIKAKDTLALASSISGVGKIG